MDTLNRPKYVVSPGMPKYTGRYHVECLREDGSVRWTEDISNLVVNQGLNHALSVITATAHVAGWFVGIGATDFALAAGAVATTLGFTQSQAFSEATLPAFTAGAIAAQSVDNSAAKAAFSINAATTLGGAYLVNSNGKAGATEGAILWGGAAFSANRPVQNGDTLNVQITVGAEPT